MGKVIRKLDPEGMNLVNRFSLKVVYFSSKISSDFWNLNEVGYS
jgi:hypothetical protein